MCGFNFGSRFRNYFYLNIIYKQKIRNRHRLAIVSDYLLLVEMAVIETASENPFTQLSPGAVRLLTFPHCHAEGQA